MAVMVYMALCMVKASGVVHITGRHLSLAIATSTSSSSSTVAVVAIAVRAKACDTCFIVSTFPLGCICAWPGFPRQQNVFPK